MKNKVSNTGRVSLREIENALELPYLIQLQHESYQWFLSEGMREVLSEVSPIEDFTGNMTLEFIDYSFGQTAYSIEECRERDMTYSTPIKVRVRLLTKEEGEIRDVKEQEIFMGDLPYMTPNGTFVFNGAERVVVSQLIRSPGVYFKEAFDPAGNKLYYAQIIPNRGAWLEFETDSNGIIWVRIDKNRKIPATILIKAMGFGGNKEILKIFKDETIIKNTLVKDSIESEENALVEIYKKLRPGDPPTVESARNYINTLFFDYRRYNLGKVGRYKINKKLGVKMACHKCGTLHKPGVTVCPDCNSHIPYPEVLNKSDIIETLRYMVGLVNSVGYIDDIDHLGNRRIRAVGELLQNQFRMGLLRLERVVKERMTVQDLETITPQAIINIRPVVAAIKEFFGSSQLSQFMDQTNALAELTHKRRISALGPGGLSRERAGFEVRDVHYSHYGRICPIETPEGPNIGLIGSLSTYAMVNEFGFIMTPYRKVKNGRVTSTVAYLTADEEDEYIVAQANTPIDEKGNIIIDKVTARGRHENLIVSKDRVEYIDISPEQIVSVATAMIPFLENDDANRALMGANMQRQGVPLNTPQEPLVGTGIEYCAAKDSGSVLLSDADGEVIDVDSSSITIKTKKGEEKKYELKKFKKSNANTLIHNRPIVKTGDSVKQGSLLADGASTVNGELSLGRNVLVAFMPWEGYNYEDAILISEKLIKDDVFTSIHIEEYDCEARDTKLGPEEVTQDIPNVSEETLKELDENGIIRIGADVNPEDILVGKVTPKGETELTAEERLLRAIFGEKARDVRDTSLKVPHGERGKVMDIKVFSRENGDELPPGVNKLVRVYVAQKRKVKVGDKMAGRHGNKGVIAKILSEEDMPYLPDGTPIQIVLNPLGVPSRMNIGQILETHLGLVAKQLDVKFECPVFNRGSEEQIRYLMRKGNLKEYFDKIGYEFDDEQLDLLIKAGSRVYRLQTFLKDKKVKLPISDEALIVQKDWKARLKDYLKEKKVKISNDDIKDIENTDEFGVVLNKIWKKSGRDFTPELIDKINEDVKEIKVLEGDGKAVLFDGRTGIRFDRRIMVGYIYIMKLAHLVDDKIHARSTGPYSLITQQPLGGKAQFGGQRFGEMEVWALEGYGAAYTLQELLTVKSDDVVGRVKAYESVVKGENILEPGVPESFKVLIKELQSLALDVKILSQDKKEIEIKGIDEDIKAAARELGLDIGDHEFIKVS